MNVIKYFISSNSAFTQLENEYLRKLLKIKLPSIKTFSDVLLPQVMELVYSAINDKLHKARSICLISDIWTNKPMYDFMGLAASITNEAFDKEVVVIGMKLREGNHCAENIQTAIQALVNKYDFDKSEIRGVRK